MYDECTAVVCCPVACDWCRGGGFDTCARLWTQWRCDALVGKRAGVAEGWGGEKALILLGFPDGKSKKEWVVPRLCRLWRRGNWLVAIRLKGSSNAGRLALPRDLGTVGTVFVVGVHFKVVLLLSLS